MNIKEIAVGVISVVIGLVVYHMFLHKHIHKMHHEEGGLGHAENDNDLE